MTARTRFVLAILLTVLTLGGLIAFAVTRFADAQARGAAGLSYVQDSGKPQPAVFGVGPGQIMLTYPGGAAERAGLRARDLILSIDGVSLRDAERLAALDLKVRNGDTVVYRIERDGKQRDVPVKFTSPLRHPLNLVSIGVHAAVALFFVVIGVFVFALKSDDRRVLVFYAMMIVGAVSILGSSLLNIDSHAVRGIVVSPEASLVPLAVMFVFIIAFMPLVLHLALVFPKERPILQRHPGVVRWVYAVPAAGAFVSFLLVGLVWAASASAQKPKSDRVDLFLEIFSGVLAVVGLLLALRLVRRARKEGWVAAVWARPFHALLAAGGAIVGLAQISGAFKLIWLTVALGASFGLLPFAILASFPILACLALYRSYRDAGVEERRQVKWPLWGTLIALITKIVLTIATFAVGTYVGLVRGDLSRSVWVNQVIPLVPVIVYLLIPISFAAAILKYRLMNIDVIIRKTVVYAILSGMIVVSYLVLVGGLGTLLVNAAGLENQTVVIASTLVVALFFVPVRNKLQNLVDRNLFRHKYDYPAALAAISASSRTAEEQGEFLTSASEKIQQALQNRAVVVFLERHGEFLATAKVGVADSILGNLRIASSIGESLGRPFDPRRRTLPDDVAAPLRKVETELVVPIESRGLIALAPKLSGAQYDVEDIDFLHSAADSIAAGINRIRMQVDEEDVSEARTIQQSLLPRFMPRVAGIDVSGIWQPARTVGGDYYDLLELSDTMLAVCIGDVAGKGMPAALLMSGLQAAVRASATATTSPREVCERVRRVVVSSLTGGRFVTFFYAVIDMKSMQIRWCNAGHNPPILVRTDGSVSRLEVGGPVLSRISRDAAFEEGELQTASGDRIVLFTDGVSEARDSDSNDFGEERLAELVVANRALGAHDLQNVIVNTALGFSRGELEDDVTLVVAALTPPA